MSLRDSRDFQNLDEVLETLNEGSQPSDQRSLNNPDHPKITLLNFDPFCRSSHFLSSPLSIEACKVQGVEEWELLAHTVDDFRDEPIPVKFKEYTEEFLELKADYYEKCRMTRLQNCIEARKKLIALRPSIYQSKDYMLGGLSYRSYQDEVNMSLVTSPKKVIESGRKQISAMKRKQIHEIELVMETEKMKDRLDTRMEEHMHRVNEIRESKKAEFERREKEAQEEKIRREHRKLDLEEQRQRSLQKNRLNYSCFEDHDDRGNNNISLLENSMAIQSARGHLSSRSKTKYLLPSEALQRRSSNVQNAEEKMKDFVHQRYTEKMLKSEDQKKRLDSERRQLLSHRRISLETKQNEMLRAKSVKEEELTSQREKRFLDKLEAVRDNKQRIAKEREYERREKSIREAEHVQQIKNKVKEGERELEFRNQCLLEDLEVDLSRAEKQKKEVLSERRQIYMLNYLKEEEAKGNMKRKEKMLKYQEDKTGERIAAYSQRMSSRSRERENITKESNSIIREFSKERVELKEEFAKLKKKLDKEHHSKYYASPSQPSTFRSGYTGRSESSSRYLKSRPRSPDQKESARDSHRRDNLSGLNDSGTFSTPNKKTRKSPTSKNHHSRSGSKTQASTSRRFQEEPSIIVGVSNNTSFYDIKEKSFGTHEQRSDFLDSERKVLDEEGTLFAGKAFSIRSAQNIGLEELINVINREMKAPAKTQGAFKKSAEAVMNTIKLNNEYIENLMHETNYLDLPWTASKSNKA